MVQGVATPRSNKPMFVVPPLSPLPPASSHSLCYSGLIAARPGHHHQEGDEPCRCRTTTAAALPPLHDAAALQRCYGVIIMIIIVRACCHVLAANAFFAHRKQ